MHYLKQNLVSYTMYSTFYQNSRYYVLSCTLNGILLYRSSAIKINSPEWTSNSQPSFTARPSRTASHYSICLSQNKSQRIFLHTKLHLDAFCFIMARVKFGRHIPYAVYISIRIYIHTSMSVNMRFNKFCLFVLGLTFYFGYCEIFKWFVGFMFV